jgi:integrase
VSADTETIRISEHIRLDKRARSLKWQARVRLADGKWHRFSTKTESFEQAREAALKFYYTAEDRRKNNLPESTRKFKRVAEFARDRMQQELEAGVGRTVYKDYITALDKYLIPFFGNYDVSNIDHKVIIEFGKWRTEQLGRKAHHSTINTHNSMLNRVLDEAQQRGWLTHNIRPKPINDGIKSKSRGSFTREEYRSIYEELRTFHKWTDKPITAGTREVLRNYVLILANTGMRHGTEALTLKWKNLLWLKENDQRYLGLFVDGKTGQRPLVARDGAIRPFERQIDLNPKLSGMTLDEVIDAKSDEYVFVTRLGQRAARANLSRNFEKLLQRLDLLYGADGRKRTLYSWRHFYATLDLQRGVSTHVLSRQMGNSTGVLDRFYSKLSPFMNPALHSGRDLSASRMLQPDPSDNTAAVVDNVVMDTENTHAPINETATPPTDRPIAENTPTTISAHVKAFDLFDAGKMSETALLVAVGATRAGFELAEDLRLRTLGAFEEGRLSEEAMIKLLS